MPKIALLIIAAFSLNLLSAQTALKVEGVTITVSDLDVSVPFFQNVLGFEKTATYTLEGKEFQWLMGLNNSNLTVDVVELKLGNETLVLQEFINEERSRPIPIDSKSNDLWFQHIAIVVGDMEKAYQILREAKIEQVSTAPQTLPEYIPSAAGIKAFYFQDPDRHNLEIIYFPQGKGDPKWQGDFSEIFLGIDHTAIGIDKTALHTDFYENLIGLKTQGRSENYGPEQEHLNQVFGARLLISGLRAKEGIGMEFLDYIAPPGGRAYPEDSLPTDLWHWHTTVKVTDINTIYEKLQKANANFVSDKVVTLEHKKQFMVRDLDGHALVITE